MRRPTKLWAAVGILVAATVLGVIAYVGVEGYVYANGININLKLYAVIGGLAMVVVRLLFLLRPRRSREKG